MGVQEMQYDGKTYLVSQDQIQDMQKKLKEAKTDAEKRAIIESIYTAANEKPQSITPQGAQNSVEEANAAVDQFRGNQENIRKLPEEYQTRYYAAGTDEEKQRAVIRDYFNDKKYFPDGVGGPSKFGNRNSTKKEGGVEFTTTLSKDVLIDDDGKPIKENQEKRFEVVKQVFAKQMDAQLAKIDQRSDLSAYERDKAKESLLINEALNSSLKPEVNALAEKIKENSQITNNNTYYQLAMTQEEKNSVNTRANQIREEMKALINKPQHELTEAEMNKLKGWKEDFNKKFPKEEQFGENEHLWDLKNATEQEQTDAYKKLDALAKMQAIEEQISSEQKAAGIQKPTGELTLEQRTKLAKAQMTEAVTHDDEIEQLTQELIIKSKNGSPKDVERIKEQIAKLDENKDKMLKDIKKGMVADQARAQVEFETYKQNYENTKVHWDNKDAKAAEKNNPQVNNTHLNEYAQKLILNDEKFRSDVCDKANGEADGDFQVNGQWYKLNSDNYKKTMLKLSNSQAGFGHENAKIDGDYFASTSEWAEFANEHAKKDSGVATRVERGDVREMFEAAGIQVDKDRTLAMRAKNIGKDALKGAIGGSLAALGGELLNAAQKLNYNGTAKAIAEGIASTTINGMVSTTITGSVSDTISGTATSIHESIVQKYDPKTGQYITVGHQVTEVPVEWSKEVTLDYSQKVDIPYKENVDIPYRKEVPADYKGSVKDSFDLGNIAKGAGIGAALGAGVRGLTYIFKKKTHDDYVNTDNARATTRTNTGYEKKADAPVEKTPVEAKTKEVKIETKIVQEKVTKEIPYEEYTLKRAGNQSETIGAVVVDRYGVKMGSPEYRAVLNYIREVNGVKNGEIPPGDKWKLPEWIPGDKIAQGHENIGRTDGKGAAKSDWKKGAKAGGGDYTGTYTDTVTRTETTTRTVDGSDVWDPNLRKRPKA